MTLRTKRYLLGALATSFLVGCVGVPVQLGSTGNVQYDATKGRPLSSRGCGFMLGGFIPIRVNSRQARAHTFLVSQARGDYVADIAAQESWSYTLVGSLYCTRLTATAYPRQDAVGTSNSDDPRGPSQADASSLAEQLERLEGMWNSGALSDEEFKRAKEKVLSD